MAKCVSNVQFNVFRVLSHVNSGGRTFPALRPASAAARGVRGALGTARRRVLDRHRRLTGEGARKACRLRRGRGMLAATRTLRRARRRRQAVLRRTIRAAVVAAVALLAATASFPLLARLRPVDSVS